MMMMMISSSGIWLDRRTRTHSGAAASSAVVPAMYTSPAQCLERVHVCVSPHVHVTACLCRYRTREEMVAWRARDPVVRFRHWLVSSGWWDEAQEKQLRHATRQQVGGDCPLPPACMYSCGAGANKAE
jgi:hypothetical protein